MRLMLIGKKTWRSGAILFITAYIAACCGCKSAPKTVDFDPNQKQQVLRELTVGGMCELAGFTAVRVEGYGVVCNLSGTGSSECPPTQREFLLHQLRALNSQGLIPKNYELMTAEQILDSTTTAAVKVSGLVPPGAPKGDIFDVEVVVLPQTQTTSLQGGWLLPTDLQVIISGESGALAGQPTARAAGPVFINPFPVSTRQGTKSDPRRGVIMGGGKSLHDRSLLLNIMQPDTRYAGLIQRRINTRFGQSGGPTIADATRSVVQIKVPPEYRTQYRHFVELLMALDLEERPGYRDLRLRELNSLAERPDADFESIALSWEAIGKDVLRYLIPLYKDPNDKRAFYAARTALNLGDLTALDAMVAMAKNDRHPCQLKAAEALGNLGQNSRTIQARSALAALLHSPNGRLRMLAYNGLRKARDGRIRVIPLPGDFSLELVDSTAGNMVCVWATNDPRIVLFGRDWQCPDNIFFDWEKRVMLNVRAGETVFSISRPAPIGREVYFTKCPLLVPDLIATLAKPIPASKEKMPALPGLTFSETVGILYQLCNTQKVIPAIFYMHRISEDLTG